MDDKPADKQVILKEFDRCEQRCRRCSEIIVGCRQKWQHSKGKLG